jgi:hypothetical protein
MQTLSLVAQGGSGSFPAVRCRQRLSGYGTRHGDHFESARQRRSASRVTTLAIVGVALGALVAVAAGIRLTRSGASTLDGPDTFGARALFTRRTRTRAYDDRGDGLDPRDPRDLVIIILAVLLFLGSAFWLIGYKLVGFG